MRSPRFVFTVQGSKKGWNLERLFKKWHDVLARFENEDASDLPYWYLERTNVGHLAIAAYEIKGRPLQEFSMTKGRGSDKGPGRADLYIYLPPMRGKVRELYVSIEAKQRWSRIGSKTVDLKRLITRSLKAVKRDCKNLTDKDWHGCHRLGVVFILPYKQKVDRGLNEVSEKGLGDFIRDMVAAAKASKADFTAIHFAPLRVSKEQPSLKKDGWCPGVAAVGKFFRFPHSN